MSRGPAKSFDQEKVLDQAMVEFWKRGYAATPISGLRQVTGLGAKSLYDTFGGKREMFLACLERYGDTVVPRMFDGLVARYPPAEAVKRILRNLLRAGRKGPARGCLLGVAAAEIENDVELSEAIGKHLDRIQESLAGALAAAPLKQGAPAPAELASMLMTLLQGVHLISRVEGTERHARRAIRVAEKLVDDCVDELG